MVTEHEVRLTVSSQRLGKNKNKNCGLIYKLNDVLAQRCNKTNGEVCIFIVRFHVILCFSKNKLIMQLLL